MPEEIREFLKCHRVAFDEGYILGVTPGSPPPFQGDFLSVSLPRPEGPDYSLFRRGGLEHAQESVQTAQLFNSLTQRDD